MDQQKQPATPETKTGTGAQPTQPQQQKSNIPQDQGNKQANPAGVNPSKPPLPYEGTTPASGAQKQL